MQKTTALFILLSILVAVVSCKKEQPTVAKIKVVNTSGNPVRDVMVRLFVTPTVSPHSTILYNDTLYTKGDGYATFNFTEDFNLGQSGFAILNIEANKDTDAGVGLIKIVEEEINEETVIIQ